MRNIPNNLNNGDIIQGESITLCPGCQAWYPITSLHICSTLRYTTPSTAPQGWQCPICRNIYSPFCNKCEGCSKQP